MADINLTIDTGVKTLELTDGRGHSVEVTFNPYDVLFLGAILNAGEELDAEQTKLRNPLQSDDWAEIYRVSMEVDKAMRKILDSIFDAPICSAIFPNQTVFAVGNGLPAWSNLLLGLIDKMDDRLGAEKEITRARIKKYSAKYKK